MKVWTKVHIKDRDKNVEKIAHSLTNYLYEYGPMIEIKRRYNIKEEDYKKLTQYTANRIGGILMLYLAQDYRRINDIVNKYNIRNDSATAILPEIEGYINKTLE